MATSFQIAGKVRLGPDAPESTEEHGKILLGIYFSVDFVDSVAINILFSLSFV